LHFLDETTTTSLYQADPRLGLVLQACSRARGIESIYVVGSVSKGSHSDQSDLDVLVVSRFPTYLQKIKQIMSLTRHNIDINIVSISLISRLRKGKSSPFIPFMDDYIKHHTLISGKNTLPEAIPTMDIHSFAVFAFCRAFELLWQFEARSDSIQFKNRERSRQLIIKRAKRIMNRIDIGVPPGWREFGIRLKEEADNRMDATAICYIVADELERRAYDLRFAPIDRVRSLLTFIVDRKGIPLHNIKRRIPIPKGYLMALYLLFKSGGGERQRIFEAESLLGLKPVTIHSNDFTRAWNRVQRVVIRDYQTVVWNGEILQS
jgi:predicted nucleotidyltransferase